MAGRVEGRGEAEGSVGSATGDENAQVDDDEAKGDGPLLHASAHWLVFKCRCRFSTTRTVDAAATQCDRKCLKPRSLVACSQKVHDLPAKRSKLPLPPAS